MPFAVRLTETVRKDVLGRYLACFGGHLWSGKPSKMKKAFSIMPTGDSPDSSYRYRKGRRAPAKSVAEAQEF